MNHLTMEDIMNTMMKRLVMTSFCVAGAIGILLIIKSVKYKCRKGMCEKWGKGIDEKLKEAKTGLDKATAHVESVFEHIKTPKS